MLFEPHAAVTPGELLRSTKGQLRPQPCLFAGSQVWSLRLPSMVLESSCSALAEVWICWAGHNSQRMRSAYAARRGTKYLKQPGDKYMASV